MHKENSSPDELLGTVIEISRQAGEKILAIYDTDFSVGEKADRSPLTAADTAAHQIICSQLAILTPDLPIFSEESSTVPFDVRKTWSRYWLVDPLDGTREFIKKNGEFTVNIALIDNHRPILGVVHVPVTGTSYFAADGQGAYRSESDQSPVRIQAKETREDSFVVAGSRSHGSEKQERFLEVLGEAEMLAIGSSLKFCLVAEGKVDIYPRFGPTSEWDTAAAHCVVEEAGGIVTDTAFRPLQYNTGESVINPDFLVIADRSFDWRNYLQKCFPACE